jgi:hypothetical protein
VKHTKLRAVLAVAIAFLLSVGAVVSRTRAIVPILGTAAVLAIILTAMHNRKEIDDEEPSMTEEELVSIAARITTASNDEIDALEAYVRSDGPHWRATPRSRFLEAITLHLLDDVRQFRQDDARDQLLQRVFDGSCRMGTEQHGHGKDPNDSKIESSKSFGVLLVITSLTGLGLVSMVVWAIIRLVVHFTS